MQNRGVIPLFISARPQPLPLLSWGFKANFHLLACLPSPSQLLSTGHPHPRASVPLWADLHWATMHVAKAVAGQQQDKPAQECSLLRQHMDTEKYGLHGGRRSTCPAWQPGQTAPQKTADVWQYGHRPTPILFLFYTNEKILQGINGQRTLFDLVSFFVCKFILIKFNSTVP